MRRVGCSLPDASRQADHAGEFAGPHGQSSAPPHADRHPLPEKTTTWCSGRTHLMALRRSLVIVAAGIASSRVRGVARQPLRIGARRRRQQSGELCAGCAPPSRLVPRAAGCRPTAPTVPPRFRRRPSTPPAPATPPVTPAKPPPSAASVRPAASDRQGVATAGASQARAGTRSRRAAARGRTSRQAARRRRPRDARCRPTTPPPPSPPPPRCRRSAGSTDVTFNQVRLLVAEGERVREREGMLQLGDGHVSIVAALAARQSCRCRTRVTAIFYSRSKQPTWRDASGQTVESKLDLGRLGFLQRRAQLGHPADERRAGDLPDRGFSAQDRPAGAAGAHRTEDTALNAEC